MRPNPPPKRKKLNKKFGLTVLILVFFLLWVGQARAEWPENPWLNGRPRPDVLVSAVAFVSPADLQFSRTMAIWKALEKNYRSTNVDFLVVAKGEPLLPFSASMIESLVAEARYDLPVLLDGSSSYAKLWRAYVSPTAYLVLQSGKVISFDPGNFDPALFEKALQKTLKENGVSPLPPRMYVNDGEAKTCGHGRTFMMGERFQKAWGSNSVSLDENWVAKPLWIEKTSNQTGKIEVTVNRSNVAVIAEPLHGGPLKITVTLDNQKIPASNRGRDVSEDKNGDTNFFIKSSRMYEIVSHSTLIKNTNATLTLTTNAKGLKIWSIQTLPFCQDF